jgi:hypothetical protein
MTWQGTTDRESNINKARFISVPQQVACNVAAVLPCFEQSPSSVIATRPAKPRTASFSHKLLLVSF